MAQSPTGTTESEVPGPEAHGQPPDPVSEYYRQREQQLTPKTKLTRTEVAEKRKASIKKAREARALLVAQREIVRKKVELGQPITEEERAALGRKFGNKGAKDNEAATIAAAAKLMIKPQSVAQLRMLVETTAAKHHYNPIEALILLAKSETLEEKERVAIHKALLPYLAPAVAPQRTSDAAADAGAMKVVIKSFQFTGNNKGPALHTVAPATVATEKEAAG